MSDETPEHILRQQGKVARPQWCTCDDGYWMRALIDPQCPYHSDYGEEIRSLLVRAAYALEDCRADIVSSYPEISNYKWAKDDLIDELRHAAE